ncbi:MAG: hypothetical protein GF411_19640 [Candidatus Lokiarchaeota archaeon]|nr:hypothetical protein [Candidatus Lokiarchaeota archaeon]
MVIRLVAKVKLDDMSSQVLYPIDEQKDERVALLMGIVQLVSAALERDDPASLSEGKHHFMKSDRGVVGYVTLGDYVYIAEADNENEVADSLTSITNKPEASKEEIAKRIQKVADKRGREISDLWG